MEMTEGTSGILSLFKQEVSVTDLIPKPLIADVITTIMVYRESIAKLLGGNITDFQLKFHINDKDGVVTVNGVTIKKDISEADYSSNKALAEMFFGVIFD